MEMIKTNRGASRLGVLALGVVLVALGVAALLFLRGEVAPEGFEPAPGSGASLPEGASPDRSDLAGAHPTTAPALAPSKPAGDSKRRRALVIGVDGATRSVIERLTAEGDLPNLAKLAAEGASGMLRSTFPLLSPRIWTTMATGFSPDEHGIEGWVFNGEDGTPQLYTSVDRKVPAVWNILSEAGRRVGVVNWLMTHPPEKIDGAMITDFAVPGTSGRRVQLGERFAGKMFPEATGDLEAPSADGGFAYPREWEARFKKLLASEKPLTPFENPFNSPVVRANAIGGFFSEIYVGDETVARTALEISETVDPDLLMVYLPGVDRLSHFLFSSLVPIDELPEAFRLVPIARQRQSNQLLNYYRFADALIGLLVARYNADDLVMVVSDHGFEAPSRAGQTFGVHETDAARDGVLYVRAPGIPGGSKTGEMSIADITPTLLCWFGLGSARDMVGECPGFLPFSRPATVDSYASTKVERTQSSESEVEEGVIDRLRALGYVK